MKKLTPIITVEEIEPCLPFWKDLLGFEVTVTVPHGDKMGFAMLLKGSVEIMYQSRASVEADIAPEGTSLNAGDLVRQKPLLFIEVEGSLEDVADALSSADIVVPRRTTFYGMDEIFVRAPCGTVIGFAARIEEA